MDTPDFLENHISQIPALLTLIKMWWIYLTPSEVLQARWNKTTNVILEDVLRKQLHKINSIQMGSNRMSVFSDANIENGIIALKSIPFNEWFIGATEYVYNLLTLGKTLEQSIDGDKKSFNLNYIDRKNIENNTFHVTQEFAVTRTGSHDSYRPDVVLFVNGIPLCVIECKRPDMKDPISQAISQHIRNQQEDGIRSLYVYTQITLALATSEWSYATAGTPEKFWGQWTEKFSNAHEEKEYKDLIHNIKNKTLTQDQESRLFLETSADVREYFKEQYLNEVLPTRQDEYLISLCDPKRLLDISFWFIVYDNNIKKIARYQQYFAIKKSVDKVSIVSWGKREWWVIWHTQWSGKSLTMVMLAQAIAEVPTIRNPKIIIVTDRTDLDKQISDTFKKCGKIVNRANTGIHLAELLESKSDAIVTTIINKFEAAINRIKKPLESHDIFVLIDEWHRTQYGSFNIQMQKSLPNACFIAMTGTPLMKNEKSTAKKFGGIIDAYTVDQAVADKAVVPLLYEWRHSAQSVNENQIDLYFQRITEKDNLNDKQKADLKKKFSRADQLNIADQKINTIARDISLHFEENRKWTGFKWQLVCQNKESAIKYKKYLDEIGIISSDVIISPPDDREWEDNVHEHSDDIVKRYWDNKMKEFGNAKKYEDTITSRFKNAEDPEIIIVVDKLLTWFDEPKNVVLYLTRKLTWHTLLQAIARVNRVAENKDFWFIIDYYGVLGDLSQALDQYTSLAWFENEDLEDTLTNIKEEIWKLAQKHSDLWGMFATIKNKKDLEAFEQLLRDQAIRDEFYTRLRDYGKTLKVAFSSISFHNQTSPELIETYKNDLAMFYKLRQSVASRFSDEIDYKKYEMQIQKLIDTHVTSGEVTTIIESINIFEKEKFQKEIDKITGEWAKADTIASRTSRYIEQKLEEDPAFYKKFSQMLKEVIRDYEEWRINESHYLIKVQEIMDKVLSHKDIDIPIEIINNDVAKAIFGISKEFLWTCNLSTEKLNQLSLNISQQSDKIIQSQRIVNRQNSPDIVKKMKIILFDMIYDDIKVPNNLTLWVAEIDLFIDRCLWVAKIKYQ